MLELSRSMVPLSSGVNSGGRTRGHLIAARAAASAMPSCMEVLEPRQLMSSGGATVLAGSANAARLSPLAAGTTTYVVSTTGNDRNAGTASKPFRTVTKALSVAKPGNTILIMPGTYHEAWDVMASGTASAPITIMGQTAGSVIFNDKGLSSAIVADGSSYVTIENITITQCSNGLQNYQAAVRTGTGWTLQNMVVQDVDGTGVCIYGSNVTLSNVTSQYNGEAGIGADGSLGGATNLLVQNCISRYNNNGMSNPSWKSQTTIDGFTAAEKVNGLWYVNPDFEAGGGKFWMSHNVTINGLQSYGNVGPGLWFDTDSTNVVIENCSIYSNRGLNSTYLAYQGSGMQIEMQDAADGPFLIENNTLSNNSGAGVRLYDAQNTTVTGNTFVNDGILMDDDGRDPNYPLANDAILDNGFLNGTISTGQGTWTTSSAATRGLKINGDVYDNGGGTLINWAGVAYTSLAAIQATLDIETNGSLGTVTA